MEKFKIKKQAVAGTLESSDIQIVIDKNEGNGISIDLESSVYNQYGRQIKKVLFDTLENLGVKDVKLSAVDKGALDCTVIARTIACVHRASDMTENINWEEIDKWNA